ncbi:hypothetical protein [Aggregatilinea lenta]|uniref:hypothetical protein n=1 Tax=Aggregatilinea lenta TaxID=913108 RepID=UPI000E5AC3B0|nr:hypothetical protein [Aggregatilinea lenta]
MKTIFALFDTYEDAKAAVEGLLERDFTPDQINVVLQAPVAKTGQESGDGSATLDRLTREEQPVLLSGSGPVIAAGDLATMLVKSAAAPGTGGLTDALQDLAIPETVAEAFASGVEEGKVLFCVKTDDDRRAENAHTVLATYSARYPGDYDHLPTDDQL